MFHVIPVVSDKRVEVMIRSESNEKRSSVASLSPVMIYIQYIRKEIERVTRGISSDSKESARRGREVHRNKGCCSPISGKRLSKAVM